MIVGVDGSALSGPRTGVGNYIAAILDALANLQPSWSFVIYSNRPVTFPPRANVQARVSSPFRRGPYWQNTHLARLVRDDRPNVFWGANGFLPLFRPRSTRTVVTVHDLVYHFAGQTLPFVSRAGRRVFQPLAVRTADRVIAVSSATASDIAKVYGRDVHAVVRPVVSPAYTLSAVVGAQVARRKWSLEAPYLLTLGTLEPRKNLRALVSAYTHCRRNGVALPTLAIVGGKGWLDTDIARAISEGEAMGYMRRLGYVDDGDLPGLYAGATAFIMPSIYEGFGMPILEAQLCGAPVLFSDRAALREAAGDVGVPFEPTVEGIERVLLALASGECPIASRAPWTIRNVAEDAATKMSEIFVGLS